MGRAKAMEPNAIEYIQQDDGARKGQLLEAARQVITNITSQTDELVPCTYFIPAAEWKFAMLTAFGDDLAAGQALAQRVLQAENAREYVVICTVGERFPLFCVAYCRVGHEPQLWQFDGYDGSLFDMTARERRLAKDLQEARTKSSRGKSTARSKARKSKEVVRRLRSMGSATQSAIAAKLLWPRIPHLQWCTAVDEATAVGLREYVADILEGKEELFAFSVLRQVPATKVVWMGETPAIMGQ